MHYSGNMIVVLQSQKTRHNNSQLAISDHDFEFAFCIV